ncbi:MAG: lamin tail domain-containing protein [Minicystis sp.]
MNNTAMGTVLAAQTAGDCKKSVCDGSGGVTTIDDDLDINDDKNDCTTDGCSAGAAKHTPLPSGTSCTAGGGKFCSTTGTCVECASGANCASNVCKNNICVAAGCNDSVQNGSETDVDCGGGTCPACGFNKKCGGDSDCAGQSCINAHCAATCSDAQKDGSETDVDCGGGSCPTCASGKACAGNGDCQSGTCKGGVCADVLLISEIQTRGDAAGANGSDEFVEIYNPMSIPVVFDSLWTVWARGATSACSALGQRFAGNGKTIPPHGHILFANAGGYNGGVTPDGTYNTGITDASQVVLLHNGALVDSVCFQYNAATLANLTCADPGAMMWFVCQGMGVSNLPHNNGTSAANNSDVSIERKPGGVAGNGQSTGDNTADFNTMVTPNPQNLMSTPVP